MYCCNPRRKAETEFVFGSWPGGCHRVIVGSSVIVLFLRKRYYLKRLVLVRKRYYPKRLVSDRLQITCGASGDSPKRLTCWKDPIVQPALIAQPLLTEASCFRSGSKSETACVSGYYPSRQIAQLNFFRSVNYLFAQQNLSEASYGGALRGVLPIVEAPLRLLKR